MNKIEKAIIYAVLAFVCGGDLAELYRLKDMDEKLDRVLIILELK